MNLKEAMQAILNGELVTSKYWGDYYVYFCPRDGIVDDSGEPFDFNGHENDGWTLYKEPEKKELTASEIVEAVRSLLSQTDLGVINKEMVDDGYLERRLRKNLGFKND